MRRCAPPQLQVEIHLHLSAKARRSSVSHSHFPDVPATTPPPCPPFPVFLPADVLLFLRGPVMSRMSAAAVSWRPLFVPSLISQSDPRRLPNPHCTSSSPCDHTLCMLRPCAPTSPSGCCACERSVVRGGREREARPLFVAGEVAAVVKASSV